MSRKLASPLRHNALVRLPAFIPVPMPNNGTFHFPASTAAGIAASAPARAVAGHKAATVPAVAARRKSRRDGAAGEAGWRVGMERKAGSGVVGRDTAAAGAKIHLPSVAGSHASCHGTSKPSAVKRTGSHR